MMKAGFVPLEMYRSVLPPRQTRILGLLALIRKCHLAARLARWRLR
jgi:hypothetical protein